MKAIAVVPLALFAVPVHGQSARDGFDEADRNGDGVISHREAPMIAGFDFAVADLDRNGFIDWDEYLAALRAAAEEFERSGRPRPPSTGSPAGPPSPAGGPPRDAPAAPGGPPRDAPASPGGEPQAHRIPPPASLPSAGAGPGAAAPPGAPGDPAEIGGGAEVAASRLFAGPGHFPPESFAAYGILAFRSAATPEARSRYVAICEGFMAGIPAASQLLERGIPLERQMGTVWPLDDAALAEDLNAESVEGPTFDRCDEIVANVDAIQSRGAMRSAARSRSGLRFRGPGPFLIAWSPAGNIGEPDVPVLVWDLSNVINSTQATEMFADWAAEIERRPELWSDGWDVRTLRRTLRLWADKYGAMVLVLFD